MPKIPSPRIGIALSGFSWIGQADGGAVAGSAVDRVRIGKDGRGTIDDLLLHLDLAGRYAQTLDLPVGGPTGIGETEGQAAGPTIDPRPLPSAKKSVGQKSAATEELPALTYGNQIDPIGSDEVTGIKVGDAAIETGVPGVDDVAQVAAILAARDLVKLTPAFRIRSHVNGFGKRIAEINVKSVGGGVPQNQLTCVVIARANGVERVER